MVNNICFVGGPAIIRHHPWIGVQRPSRKSQRQWEWIGNRKRNITKQPRNKYWVDVTWSMPREVSNLYQIPKIDRHLRMLIIWLVLKWNRMGPQILFIRCSEIFNICTLTNPILVLSNLDPDPRGCFHSHGGSPRSLDGFISWKIPSRTEWWLRLPPWNPPWNHEIYGVMPTFDLHKVVPPQL